MHRCAMPCLIEGVGATAAAIFSRAEASASGLRVSSAPDASARYSRWRETASETTCAMIGASTIDTTHRTAKRIPRPPPPPLRSFELRPRPPPHQSPRRLQSASSRTAPARAATTVISRTS